MQVPSTGAWPSGHFLHVPDDASNSVPARAVWAARTARRVAHTAQTTVLAQPQSLCGSRIPFSQKQGSAGGCDGAQLPGRQMGTWPGTISFMTYSISCLPAAVHHFRAQPGDDVSGRERFRTNGVEPLDVLLGLHGLR